MEEKLQITREKALQIYDTADVSKKQLLEELFGKSTFKKTPMESLKTIDDILKKHNITREQFDSETISLTSDEKAYRLLKMLASILNEGWTPNWDDSSEYKYFPYFVMSSSGFRFGSCAVWRADSNVGSRLCFKSKELAEYAGKQFAELYKEYMIIK